MHGNIIEILKNKYKFEFDQIISPSNIEFENYNKLSYCLDNPIKSEPINQVINKNDKVCVVLLDETRYAPQGEMIKSILKKGVNVENFSYVIANGTHKNSDPWNLQLNIDDINFKNFFNHDSISNETNSYIGEFESDFSKIFPDFIDEKELKILSDLSRYKGDKNIFTSENLLSKSRVLINEKVKNADKVILFGNIKPHYFAGYSGGGKSLLPGVSSRSFILKNHLLKIHPKSTLGNVVDNPVRDDLEKGVSLISEKISIFNVIVGPQKNVIGSVFGDYISAHRKGVEIADRIFRKNVKKTDVIIVTDVYPVTMNIKQLKKVIGAALKIVNQNGIIIVMGDCFDGLGSSSKLNEYIYKLYLRNNLPQDVEIFLMSELSKNVVESTGFLKYIKDYSAMKEIIKKKFGNDASISFIPYGTKIIPEIR